MNAPLRKPRSSPRPRVLAAPPESFGDPREQMRQGAFCGIAACLLFALLGGAPAPLLPVVALFGMGAGAVIGLVLWCGGDLPEDPVLPPAPGQARPDRVGRKPARAPVARMK